MTTLTANGKMIAPKRLSLACGQRKPDGFFGVDISPDSSADLVHDLLDFPWPIKTASAREISCDHFIEHLPHHRPGWGKDGWFLFFDELHRVCGKDAVCTFTHPYVMSGRAFWDPTHVRFISEVSWYYLSKDWRTAQGLDHYPADHDFEVVTVDGMGLSDQFESRSDDQQMFAREHYWNVVHDLRVMLRAVK